MFIDSNIKVDRDRCLACGECVDRCIMDNLRLSVPPCRQHCPLGLNCQGYVRLLAQGKAEDAAARLRKDTPFGALLGRVCHHPCESHCERGKNPGDGAVHLRAIKRYLAERYPQIVNAPGERAPASGRSVGIVGAGPAGLMAAYQLAAAGNAVTVYERRPRIGGLLRYAIPAYRLPDEVLDAMQAQLEALGVVFKTGMELGGNLGLEQLRADHAACLLAPGLSEAATLPPLASAPAVVSALDLLRGLRSGEALDLPPLKGLASAVVVGGGNTALDAAVSLRKAGVGTVTLLTLEGPHELPVHEEELEEAREAGVLFAHRWGVKGASAAATGLDLELVACLSAFDAQGRFAPSMSEDITRRLHADLVVLAVGQRLEAALRALLPVDNGLLSRASADKAGQVLLFAAGDSSDGPGAVVDALASGKEAARRVQAFLDGAVLSSGRTRFDDDWAARGMVRDYESLPERARGGARCPRPRIPVDARSLSAEVERTFSDEEARREAERCLACGRSFEANQTCWFCLPCEIECPTEALAVQMPYQVR